MNYYALRTNDHITVVQALGASIGTRISFSNLSWYLDEIKLNDICFLKISGDEAKKLTSYDNSLVAIAKVIKTPYNIHIPVGMSINHGTIDIEIINVFDSITADELYKYPSLKNTLSIGASTKGMPNQAIGKLTIRQGEDIIKALKNESRLSSISYDSYNITNNSLDIFIINTINV